MTREQIQSTLQGILRRIAPEADFSAIPPDASLRETLDIDSFDYLRFIMDLHKELKVEIPEADYPKLGTLRAVVDYLASRVA